MPPPSWTRLKTPPASGLCLPRPGLPGSPVRQSRHPPGPAPGPPDLRQPVSVCLYPLHQGTKCPDAPLPGTVPVHGRLPEDLAHACRTLGRLLNKAFAEDSIQTKGRHRHWHDIDPTLPEALFEQAFIDCYGRESLDRVTREFPVIDMNGRTRWVDFFIQLEK
ncbi:MAG: hypothetical protein LC660_02860 [Desulfobacteraceae bacterium]|nr:hypothetical protein [Desulfobacteraceae bacterium]